MLLGLAILLLNVVEDHITTTCVRVNPETDTTGGGGVLKPWLSRVTGTAEVSGCACCLAKTKGVSHCFMEVSEAAQRREKGGGRGGRGMCVWGGGRGWW